MGKARNAFGSLLEGGESKRGILEAQESEAN